MKYQLRITWSLICFLFIGLSASQAQVNNDECRFAEALPNTNDFCEILTLGGATLSTVPTPSCWIGTNHTMDIWYAFVPEAPGIYIQLRSNVGLGTLNQPLLTLYEGRCTNLTELACDQVSLGENFMEITQTGLNVGRTYYLRISARNGNTGTFQLCVDSFFPKPSPEADCPDGVVLCDKEPFIVENLTTAGTITNEVNGTCIGSEFASSWYKWTCDQAGSLTFSLTPNNPNNREEDLDFVVYELPNGIDNCAGRIVIRCMASGETGGCPFNVWEPCTGSTGLRDGSTDIREDPGCFRPASCASGPGIGQGEPAQFDDNFLAPIMMESGKSYALVVNNFSRSGYGFAIEFGGTGTFLGPEVDFEVEALNGFECDKTIRFINSSESLTDPITEYVWDFGNGATPNFENTRGPFDVIYDSFGDKLAALTVRSSRGCQVTKVVNFFVEPCCADTSRLAVTASVEDLICNGVPTGRIFGEGQFGAPEYSFSLDGQRYQLNPRFFNLPAGQFELFIRDIKGCINRTLVNIQEPPPLVANAGPDITVELGESIIINGSYLPNTNASVSWDPPLGLDFPDQLSTPGTPPRSLEYTLTVEDEAGCISRDQMRVIVNVVRPVFWPNIILPGSGINGRFSLTGGRAVRGIKKLSVFDRWGNLVYDGSDLPINDYTRGWDGSFKGQNVVPGVYAWIAEVEFIDDEVLVYKGDVTVIQ